MFGNGVGRKSATIGGARARPDADNFAPLKNCVAGKNVIGSANVGVSTLPDDLRREPGTNVGRTVAMSFASFGVSTEPDALSLKPGRSEGRGVVSRSSVSGRAVA